jgi:hypothetical protein
MRFLDRLEALDTGGSLNTFGTADAVRSQVHRRAGTRDNNGVHDNMREEP